MNPDLRNRAWQRLKWFRDFPQVPVIEPFWAFSGVCAADLLELACLLKWTRLYEPYGSTWIMRKKAQLQAVVDRINKEADD